MKQLDSWERNIVDEAVEQDRPKLFALGDMVSARAVDRDWNVLLVDGGRGQLVGDFLLHVLRVGAGQRGEEPPRAVTVANSRQAAGWGHRREHRHSALELLMSEGVIGNALLVTDIVDQGNCLRRLGRYARDMSIEADYAILATPAETERKLRRQIHAPRRSEVYYLHSKEEPYLAGDTITQGLGLWTEPGSARMQPHPHPWPWVGEFVRERFSELAEEYVQSRMLQPLPES